jgi:hypothetical protein
MLWFEGYLVKEIEVIQNWLKNGNENISEWDIKEEKRRIKLSTRLLDRIRERP